MYLASLTAIIFPGLENLESISTFVHLYYFSWFLFRFLLFSHFLFLPNTLMIQRNIFLLIPFKAYCVERQICLSIHQIWWSSCTYIKYLSSCVSVLNFATKLSPLSVGMILQPCEKFSSVFLFRFLFSTFLYFFSWPGDLEFDAGARRRKSKRVMLQLFGTVSNERKHDRL